MCVRNSIYTFWHVKRRKIRNENKIDLFDARKILQKKTELKKKNRKQNWRRNEQGKQAEGQRLKIKE